MYDIAIIGAGPAGSSAALFAAKAGKKTLVVDSDKSMTKRAWVDNHYGVEGISGPDLLEIGRKQATKFGAEWITNMVTEITNEENHFTIETENGSFEAQQIILATGVSTNLSEKLDLKTKDGTEPRIKTVFDVDAQGKTSVPGIWAAGTAAGVSVHTIITAGDGAKVAINVISELNGQRYVDHDLLRS
ncbi:FAD-dependent oxidoreductase [Peribacillus sp. SCS-155]|uniref:NAD(P)/FAD-dependent oxidoreductase n=1 Tax=Peribacillus sedimenti TaxID=3115297 RepID=UPI0039069D9B